jgi:hypothetical protein
MMPRHFTVGFLPKGTTVLAAIRPGNDLPQDLRKYVVDTVKFLANRSSYITFSGQFIPIVLQEDLTITFSVSDSRNIQKKLNNSTFAP